MSTGRSVQQLNMTNRIKPVDVVSAVHFQLNLVSATQLFTLNSVYYSFPAFDILFIGSVLNTKIVYTTADLQLLQDVLEDGELEGDDTNATSWLQVPDTTVRAC